MTAPARAPRLEVPRFGGLKADGALALRGGLVGVQSDRPGILALLTALEVTMPVSDAPGYVGDHTLLARPGPARRIPVEAVCAPPPGTHYEAAPQLLLTPNACPHAHQEAHAGCWRCLDCPAVLGYVGGAICSVWTPGALSTVPPAPPAAGRRAR